VEDFDDLEQLSSLPLVRLTISAIVDDIPKSFLNNFAHVLYLANKDVDQYGRSLN
jgi:hypothetical protein